MLSFLIASAYDNPYFSVHFNKITFRKLHKRMNECYLHVKHDDQSHGSFEQMVSLLQCFQLGSDNIPALIYVLFLL